MGGVLMGAPPPRGHWVLSGHFFAGVGKASTFTRVRC